MGLTIKSPSLAAHMGHSGDLRGRLGDGIRRGWCLIAFCLETTQFWCGAEREREKPERRKSAYMEQGARAQ